MRHDAGYFREEPGAGKPHARICEGEAEWPSYSTTTSAQAQKNAGDTLKAQQAAALWAMWMVIIGAAETAVTGIGVFFVIRTLEETKRSARAAEKAADAALLALDRPWLYLDQVSCINVPQAHGKQLLCSVVRATNYGTAPAVIVSARGVLFRGPSPMLQGPLIEAIGQLPDSMMLFPDRTQIGRFIFDKGRDAESGGIGTPRESLDFFYNLTPALSEGGIVVRPNDHVDLVFRAKGTTDTPEDDSLTIDGVVGINLIGLMIYAAPADEWENLTFTFVGDTDDSFIPYGGAPYNERTRTRYKSEVREMKKK